MPAFHQDCMPKIGAGEHIGWDNPYSAGGAYCRPRGSFISTLPYSAFSGTPVTRAVVQLVVLAFTHRVVGLAPGSFNVTGPPAVRAMRLQQTADHLGSIFKLRFSVPANYLGPITVSLQVRGLHR